MTRRVKRQESDTASSVTYTYSCHLYSSGLLEPPNHFLAFFFLSVLVYPANCAYIDNTSATRLCRSRLIETDVAESVVMDVDGPNHGLWYGISQLYTDNHSSDWLLVTSINISLNCSQNTMPLVISLPAVLIRIWVQVHCIASQDCLVPRFLHNNQSTGSLNAPSQL